MKNIVEIIDDLQDCISRIKEAIFGYGFEDFRINRKLKIEITKIIEDMLEIYETNIEQYRNIISAVTIEYINSIKMELMKNDAGINEKYLWQICKKEIPIIEKHIQSYRKENI